MILPAVAVLLVAEVAVLVVVVQQIGVLATILLLLAGSVVGGWLLRREGTRAWRAFAVAVAEGRPPGREVLDGMLVLLGGALVLFPGFVSDVLGLLCLLPLSRRGVGGLLRRYAARRGRAGVVRVRARRGPASPSARIPAAPGPPAPASSAPTPSAPKPSAPASSAPTPSAPKPSAPGPPAPGAGRVIEGEIEP